MGTRTIDKLPTGFLRVLAFILPVIELAASFAVLVVLALAFADDKPLGKLGPLVHTYWLVLAGAVGHLLIDAFKRKKYGWATAVEQPAHWLDWWLLHAYSVGLVLVAPLATCILLRALEVGFDSSGTATIILAGYSADSIADLAFSRVNALSAVATKTITAKVPAAS